MEDIEIIFLLMLLKKFVKILRRQNIETGQRRWEMKILESVNDQQGII
jgi:hypothetical protein